MRLNLIIDGNYLMQKSVFVLFKLRNLYTDLPVILEKDYNTLTNLFYFNKIYFISDSRSNWRKKYYTEYKGKRKKNEKIDWDTVYEIYKDFKDEINKKKNCEVCQIDNLEGDDLISFIIKKSNINGDSNMIIANDSDLFQLININNIYKTINFMYNFKFNDEILYMPYLYKQFIDNIEVKVDDLFGGNSNNSEIINFLTELVTNKKVKEINSEKELFIKIIGHNKDNIKSIYMKGNRGIGKTGAEKIYDFYKDTYPDNIDFNSNEFKDRLIEVVKFIKKIKDNTHDKEMLDRLNMNLKLVKLDKISTPDNLYEKMKSNITINI